MMELKHPSFLFVLLQVWCCHACLEEERLALLQLQAFFGYSNNLNENDGNCCEWNIVKCDAYTRRVTHLRLWGTAFARCWSGCYLNASLFLPFKLLSFLDLGFNGLVGYLPNEGFERLEGLNSLEYLGLSHNFFNSSILSSIGGLSSLKSLNLSQNSLKGTIYVEDIRVFPYLKTLYAGSINLTGNTFYQELHSFTNVEELYLDGSVVDNNLFLSLEALPSLKTLSCGFDEKHIQEMGSSQNTNLTSIIFESIGRVASLEFLSLYGLGLASSETLSTLQLQGLCNLKHLQTLVLRNNSLNGILPWCIVNLTSLQNLDLSNNFLMGNISLSPITLLTSIQDLRLENNRFQIPTSLVPFYNFSKLQHLDVRVNELYAETVPHNLTPKFQLEGLDLPCHGCGGFLPKFLYHC